jgi:hypothetical protein
VLKAQDRIYYLDGSSKDCAVLEIGPEEIQANINGEVETIYKNNLLLIKFKNGSTEIINTPTTSVIYNPTSGIKSKSNQDKIHKSSYLSVNTLALCNADISAFYEYISPAKIIGLGLVGAYNFNLSATAPNLFIAVLPNAKKNYDLGVTLNIYPSRLKYRTNIYYGLMTKYTSFRFSTDTSTTGTIVNYKPTEGKQLATLFTIGSHTSFNDHLFIKTICGLGFFKLNGDYEDQYNREFNKNAKGPPVHFKFLPKAYLGINAGFNF